MVVVGKDMFAEDVHKENEMNRFKRGQICPPFTDECQLCMARIGEGMIFYIATYAYHTL